MNELALFTGAGGGLLGTRLLGWRPVCGVEVDPYCREILLRRQEEGHLEAFPVWDDVRTFDGLPWRGVVDVVTAGFPCQPFSQSGRQRGHEDPRNMWPETKRFICEVQPMFAFLENVAHLARHAYFQRILGDLCEIGFDARWAVVSAGELGASHTRGRLWILASNTKRFGVERCQRQLQSSVQRSNSCVVTRTVFPQSKDDLPSPRVLGAGHGVAAYVDRVRAIGNGQVPGVVAAAWQLLGGVE